MTFLEFSVIGIVLNRTALSVAMGKNANYLCQVMTGRIAWSDKKSAAITAVLKTFNLEVVTHETTQT